MQTIKGFALKHKYPLAFGLCAFSLVLAALFAILKLTDLGAGLGTLGGLLGLWAVNQKEVEAKTQKYQQERDEQIIQEQSHHDKKIADIETKRSEAWKKTVHEFEKGKPNELRKKILEGLQD